MRLSAVENQVHVLTPDPEIGETQDGPSPLMTSECSLGSAQYRARNERNLRLTPPCSREMQVLGVVGHENEDIDRVARRAGGEEQERVTDVAGS